MKYEDIRKGQVLIFSSGDFPEDLFIPLSKKNYLSNGYPCSEVTGISINSMVTMFSTSIDQCLYNAGRGFKEKFIYDNYHLATPYEIKYILNGFLDSYCFSKEDLFIYLINNNVLKSLFKNFQDMKRKSIAIILSGGMLWQ